MNTHAHKASETKSTSMANGSPKRQPNGRDAVQLADNRPEATALMKIQELANDSPQVSQLRALQQFANNSPQVSQLRSLQRIANNSPQAKQASQFQALADATSPLPIQQKIANSIAQLVQKSEEEELIQAKPQTAQRQPSATDGKPRPNNTGLPDNLKSGIEALSGMSLDHVKVHYNSAQPAQLNALAYARGSDIHLAPGQEQHLPHEAWHIVQQAQGRVQPTMQMQDGVPVNDDAGLEREADLMGGGARNTTTTPVLKLAPIQTVTTTAQLYYDLLVPGYRISTNHLFAVSTDDNKELISTKTFVSKANYELRKVGALVTLQCDQQLDEHFWTVVPTINPYAVKSAVWARMATRQPAAVADAPTPFRTFADCLRTGTSVAGIDPGAKNEPPMVLDLATGAVNVMTALEGRGYGTSSLAARATASFFLDTLPKFRGTMAALPLPLTPAQRGIVEQLDRFGRLNGAPKITAGHNAYKLILADAGTKAAFVGQFGINGAVSPIIGTTLTQYNDPAEKEDSHEDKWNFHWAGIVLVDGADYVTLENCAIELEDATTAEMGENIDILNDHQNPKARTVKNQRYTKQDILNNRWYFKAYGANHQSFHDEMLADPHATPSAITLPIRKR
jgi:hypothetical protein